ncbi:hypothetical protein MJM83_28790, partial [Salmonella enterica subsp. enterica serovar Montevideo]|nr:hypothetical protein [Salmonella enterica subsp. enterica serovar Montevideo]
IAAETRLYKSRRAQLADTEAELRDALASVNKELTITQRLEKSETGRLLQDVAREALGDQIPLAVISGPTFAKELAAGLPTAISL